ncbi:unnamed protein product, partial [Prorocentrum cordatum]
PNRLRSKACLGPTVLLTPRRHGKGRRRTEGQTKSTASAGRDLHRAPLPPPGAALAGGCQKRPWPASDQATDAGRADAFVGEGATVVPAVGPVATVATSGGKVHLWLPFDGRWRAEASSARMAAPSQWRARRSYRRSCGRPRCQRGPRRGEGATERRMERGLARHGTARQPYKVGSHRPPRRHTT